jgi:hypothetical protein
MTNIRAAREANGRKTSDPPRATARTPTINDAQAR